MLLVRQNVIKMLSKDKGKYMEELSARTEKNKNRVSEKFQSTGLAITEILGDPSHKALYIKLAKEHNEEKLLELAKDVAGRKDIKNPGAYFMRRVQQLKQEKRLLSLVERQR